MAKGATTLGAIERSLNAISPYNLLYQVAVAPLLRGAETFKQGMLTGEVPPGGGFAMAAPATTGGLLAGPSGTALGSGLLRRAYHGTDADIARTNLFNAGAEGSGWVPDRALGTHFAADPAVASKFAHGLYRGGKDPYVNPSAGPFPGGRVYPVDIDTTGFKQVEQAPYDWRDPAVHKPHEAITTDQNAIAQMMNVEGFKARPDILERYLIEARKMPEREAKEAALKMASGESATVHGVSYDLKRFVSDHGGTPYNDADRMSLVKAAKDAFEKQGIKGFSYLNTSPREMEGVTDPTSYIPLARGTVKSATTGETLYSGGLLGSALPSDAKRRR